METIGVFFADGFEEIEALTVVDILRRAGENVEMISVGDALESKGSHGITVQMDKMLADADFGGMKMIILPGGGQGTIGLEACGPLMEKLDSFYKEGKYIAAICAAPSILGHRGFLKGRKATSYPGFEDQLDGAIVTQGDVEADGTIITGRGMGCSIPFALEILTHLQNKETADKMAETICYQP